MMSFEETREWMNTYRDSWIKDHNELIELKRKNTINPEDKEERGV